MGVRLFSSAIKIRIVLRFLTNFSNTMVMPFVVVFFVEQVGIKTASWMIVCIGISSILGYLIGGEMADQYGRKKIILTGELLVGVGFIIVAVSNMPIGSKPLLSFIAFIIIYFFSSVASPAYSAFIIDETTDDNRKAVYTVLLWTAYLSFALGSLTGGLLFYQYATQLFLIVAITSFISFICVFIWIDDKYQRTLGIKVILEANKKSKFNKLKIYKEMLRFPAFISVAYITLIFGLMDNQLSYYLSIRYVSLFGDEGYKIIGILRTENTLLALGLMVLTTKYLKKINEANSVITSSIIFFIGYILLSISELPFILFLAMSIVTIGEIILLPATQTMTAKIIPDENRSTYLGVLGVVSTIGGLLASLTILLIDFLSTLGFTFVYLGIGILTIIVVTNLKSIIKIESIS